MAGLYGQDLLGWAVTTSVWTDVDKALNTASKAYADLGGLAALGLTYAALLSVLTLAAIALRLSVWRFILGFTFVFALCLCELDRRKLRAYRGGHACGSAKVWHQLVVETHERGGLHHRASRGAYHRQFLPPPRGMAEGGDPARTLHQDRHRDPRRVPGRDRRREAQSGHLVAHTRRGGHRRGVSHLLGGRLFRGSEVVRIQPRIRRAACLRYFNLRRRCSHRDRRRDPRPACRADPRLFARGDFRRRRDPDPAVSGADIPLERAACRGRMDGVGDQDRRSRRRGRRHHRSR